MKKTIVTTNRKQIKNYKTIAIFLRGGAVSKKLRKGTKKTTGVLFLNIPIKKKRNVHFPFPPTQMENVYCHNNKNYREEVGRRR